MFTILFLVIHLNTSLDHPIHVSLSEVEIVSGKITWTSRIYRDDLLLALYGKNVELSAVEDEQKVKKDILKYLSAKIYVSINRKSLSWSLDELQPDPEAIWITMSASIPQDLPASMTVRNNILLEVYHDQKNITNFSWSTGKKNIVFDSGSDQKVISF